MTKERFKTIDDVAEFFGVYNPYVVNTPDSFKVCYLVDKTKAGFYPICEDPRNHGLKKYFSDEMLIEEANRIAMGTRDIHDWDAARIAGFGSCMEMAINQEKDLEFLARIHAKYP